MKLEKIKQAQPHSSTKAIHAYRQMTCQVLHLIPLNNAVSFDLPPDVTSMSAEPMSYMFHLVKLGSNFFVLSEKTQ